MVGMVFNNRYLVRLRNMKKLLVVILSFVVLAACQSCTNSDGKTHTTNGCGSAMALQEQEDLMEYRKSQANYGEIFRSLMETFRAACEIFDDYGVSDDVYMTMSYSDIREHFTDDSDNYMMY